MTKEQMPPTGDGSNKKNIFKTAAIMMGLTGVVGGVTAQEGQPGKEKQDTAKEITYEKPDTSVSTINPFEGEGDDPSIPSIEEGSKMLQENADLLNAYLKKIGTYQKSDLIDEKAWHETRSDDLGVGAQFGPKRLKDTTYNKPINKYQRYIRWSDRPDAPMILIDSRIVPSHVDGYEGLVSGESIGRSDLDNFTEFVEIPTYESNNDGNGSESEFNIQEMYDQDKEKNDHDFRFEFSLDDLPSGEQVRINYQGVDKVKIRVKKNGTEENFTSLDDLENKYPDYGSKIKAIFSKLYEKHVAETVWRKIVSEKEKTLSNNLENYVPSQVEVDIQKAAAAKKNSGGTTDGYDEIYYDYYLKDVKTPQDRYNFYKKYNTTPEKLAEHMRDKYYLPLLDPKYR